MIWFVISIILLLFSAAVTGVALSNNVKGAGIGLIPGLVGLLLLIPACLYSVDVGEVAVIRNMGGSLAGHSEDAGFHWKTPWQSVIKYDTRNNLINFYKDTDYKYDGGSAVGKQVTVNDRSGASVDIDIQVNYSLDPSAAATRRLNSDPQWDRTLIFPRFGDVVVDRDRRQITARCMWKIKADYQMKES